MQDCSLDFGGLTAWHASVKPHWCMSLYKDAGGCRDPQTRGAPQS